MLLAVFFGFNARFGTSTVSLDDEGTAYSNPMLREGDYAISAYDAIIRNISEQEGNDWRLISAIAYHESRFQADLVSHRGARGLMQIMPSVAQQFDIPAERSAEPEINVWLANKLLTSIAESLRLPAGVPERDRISMVLASYNSGVGRVKAALSLARYYGDDPDSWEVVAHYLTLAAKPEYYENEVVKCGRFTGSRFTRAYVDDVLGRYDKYCRTVAR